MSQEELENQEDFSQEELTVEDRAAQYGWKPFDDWDGDPNEWVGPEAFLVKGEMIQQLRAKDKEMKQIKKTVDQLAEHNRKISEIEYNKALKKLQQDKKRAYEDEDFDKVVEIDDQINEFKQNKDELTGNVPAAEENGNPDFEQWVQQPENQWYVNNNKLRRYADAVAVEYAQKNPNASFDEVAQIAAEETKDAFPDEFEGTSRRRRGPKTNEPMSRKGNTPRAPRNRRKASVRDLDDEQRAIAKRFVKAGVFKNEQEYVDQLAELGEV